jgi:hypothetical protein
MNKTAEEDGLPNLVCLLPRKCCCCHVFFMGLLLNNSAPLSVVPKNRVSLCMPLLYQHYKYYGNGTKQQSPYVGTISVLNVVH